MPPQTTIIPSNITKSNDFHKIRLRELQTNRNIQIGTPQQYIQPKYFIKSLRDICIQTLANNYSVLVGVDILREEDPELYNNIISLVKPNNIPLDISIKRIDNDEYWRSACECRWAVGQLYEYKYNMGLLLSSSSNNNNINNNNNNNNNILDKGMWKRLFIQRHCAEYIMSLYGTNTTDEQELNISKLCEMCKDYIYNINITHQRCHFNIYNFCKLLPKLEELRISYITLNAAVTYNSNMIGIQENDIIALQKILKNNNNNNINTLRLPANRINSTMLKVLLVGMVRNNIIKILDLSHNIIGDDGIEALCLILEKKDCSIEKIDLSNNIIRGLGAGYLGKALGNNNNCKVNYLSLRMNRICDNGGDELFRYLINNKSLNYLDVSCNSLGSQSAESLSTLLQKGKENNNINNINNNNNNLDDYSNYQRPHYNNNNININNNNNNNNNTIPLRTLHIYGNNSIGEDGGKLIAMGISHSTELIEMDCRQCGIHNDDIMRIKYILNNRVQRERESNRRAVQSELDSNINIMVREKILRTHGV